MEKEIGKVVHFFNKAMVAVISLTDDLAVGETIKFVHDKDELVQKVESMQVEHKPIQAGKAGEEVAIKVEKEIHKHAKIFKVTD